MKLMPPLNVSIIIKVLLLSLMIGFGVGGLLDHYQQNQLRDDFERQLQQRLEYEAILDRELFDRHVRSMHLASRLIASQKNIHSYLDSPQWQRKADKPKHYLRVPPWLPPSSILRAFFTAQVAILLDADGVVREIYHRVPEEQGMAILHAIGGEPIQLLRKLSHSQAYMTSLTDAPYVISSKSITSDNAGRQATLLLVSALDDEFLYSAKQSRGEDSILSLLDARGERVIASSDPFAIPSGKKVEQLQQQYMMIGKSFFDYGASDLELQIASFVATTHTDRIIDKLLSAEGTRRGVLIMSFVLTFTLLAMYVGLRIRRLNEQVQEMSQTFLGINTERGEGDEIGQLENQFRQLTFKLESAKSDNVSLMGKVVDSEHASNSLRVVTELLAVGVIVDGPKGVVPYNKLMEGFASDFGGLAPFILREKEHDEIHAIDKNGIRRSFSIDHHADLGDRGALVRETTSQRRLEEERDFFANFPSYNPNPMAQVDQTGNLLYANLAMQELMQQVNPEDERRLPEEWMQSLERRLEEGMSDSVEFEVGGRSYSFVGALLGARDVVFLFGQDITEKRRAEHDLKLAAMVTRSVLDGIVITDSDGIIQQANPAIATILGYSEEQLYGKTLQQIHSPENDESLEQVWEKTRQDGHWQGELWCAHRNHTDVMCLVRINAIAEGQGEAGNYVVVYSDITEHKRVQDWLRYKAFHDELTQLPNRALLEDRLQQSIARAERSGRYLALLYLDLDGFKPVNDRLGHDIGDQLLCGVSQRLSECVRSSDTVSRVGGDEFIILLSDLDDDGVVHEVAQKALDAVNRKFRLAGEDVRVSASIGIALYPRDGESAEELVKAADSAMYEVKRGGKNAYRID